MPYIKAVTKAGNTLIIEKYYSSRYKKKGIERSENQNKTSEAQEKCNLRKAERKVTILLNANFAPGDWHLVLDYSPDNRPATPRESQKECEDIYKKDKEAVPESRHGTEIRRSGRVWKKRGASSSYRYEQLRRRHERNEKQMVVWTNPSQPVGRYRGIFKTGMLHS